MSNGFVTRTDAREWAHEMLSYGIEPVTDERIERLTRYVWAHLDEPGYGIPEDDETIWRIANDDLA